jgi:hypothetical protein
MVFAISILLLAVGVLLWSLNRSVSGVEGSTIGAIMVALGGVGLLGSVLVSARAARGRRATEGLDDDRVAAVEEGGTTEDETWSLGGHRRPPSP